MFSHQNEPHSAKLSSSAVFKNSWGNWLKTSLLGKKVSSHQSEQHSAKLSFTGVLKHFCGNWPKNYHLVQIVFFSTKWAIYS